MKIIYCNLFLLFFLFSFSQDDAYMASIEAFQDEYTEHYENPKTSPYKKNTHLFNGHNFFPINEQFKVKAVFIPAESNAILNTSTSRLAEYTRLGVLEFQLEGKTIQLAIYYSDGFAKDEDYADKAFVPFMDLTNGETTYANGRYCYVKLPTKDGEEVVLDFNKSTNPYCAYVGRYSCTVPPEENEMDIAILAGVKNPNNK